MTMKITNAEFRRLMHDLATAWSGQDTQAAIDCFASNAVYMEPPDIQIYVGHDQLRPYFDALGEGTFMRFHHLSFDEESQRGAGEYSFRVEGSAEADHGVAIVELIDGRIAKWREYQRKGPAEFASFCDVEGKEWKWHIGNYP